MKRLMLLLLIGLNAIQWAKADLGSCVVYEAKFYLKDGRVFNGCFEYSGYDSAAGLGEDGYNEYCSDTGILELIRKIQEEGQLWNWEDGGTQSSEDFGKIAVYRRLLTLTLRPMRSSQQLGPVRERHGFVLPDDIVFVDSANIDRVVFWQAYYAQHDWLTSEKVIGSEDMITTIQDQQYWNRLTIDLDQSTDSLAFTKDTDLVMWGVEMINYNPKNNVAELKRLAELKFKVFLEWKVLEATIIEKYGIDNSGEDHHLIHRVVEEGRERYFQEMREWFWERGILLIEVYGTC